MGIPEPTLWKSVKFFVKTKTFKLKMALFGWMFAKTIDDLIWQVNYNKTRLQEMTILKDEACLRQINLVGEIDELKARIKLLRRQHTSTKPVKHETMTMKPLRVKRMAKAVEEAEELHYRALIMAL